MTTLEKPQPTRLQEFMWLFSGSEIHVLRECGTDYNRHATIGFSIFLTSAIAFVLAFVAGLKFSDGNIAIGIFAGVLWGLLVFSIDRSMVMSLKKDPDNPSKKIWFPLLIRASLASVICFVIAIPLETLIFGEEIRLQMEVDNSKKIQEQQDRLYSTYGIAGLGEAVNESTEAIDSLFRISKTEPNEPQYWSMKRGHEAALAAVARLEEDRQIKTDQAKILLQKIPYLPPSPDGKIERNYNSTPGKQYQALRNEVRLRHEGGNVGTITVKIEQGHSKADSIDGELEKCRNAWTKEKQSEIKKAQSNYQRLDSTKQANELAYQRKDSAFSNQVNRTHGFVREFAALNNIDDKSTHFLIWFIRIVLFIIELLPSVTKVYGKPTTYDFALAKKEEIERLEINDHAMASKDLEEVLLKEKIKLEQSLQLEVLRKILEVQKSLAEEALEKWKAEELQRINLS
jgi:hypothetical protein